MDQGTLPRRNGVRPHINLTTTIEGVKNKGHYHHRLVHEGQWQVISGREFRFLPPERAFMRRARGPGMRWAA